MLDNIIAESRSVATELSSTLGMIKPARVKLLLGLDEASEATNSANVTIKVASRYHEVAEVVAKEWKKLGINAKIEDEESIPSTFQIYLGDFALPRDPDQYVLWHSTSGDNITRLRSQRLDKLLEDGRKITEHTERQKMYTEFQKYLLDEAPAAFLYFPYDFVVTRD